MLRKGYVLSGEFFFLNTLPDSPAKMAGRRRGPYPPRPQPPPLVPPPQGPSTPLPQSSRKPPVAAAAPVSQWPARRRGGQERGPPAAEPTLARAADWEVSPVGGR